jgi:HD-GYP domain-containing protein (c-di-GMP phosphodiesterase class II)
MNAARLAALEGIDLYRGLMEHVRETTQAVGAGERVEVQESLEIARLLIERYAHSTALLETAMTYHDPADLAVSHAVNVAAYALKMGLDAGLADREVEELVAAGLLHDIGFGAVPVFHRDQTELMAYEQDPGTVLAEEDHRQVHQHPRIGAEALRPDTAEAVRIAGLILQHHEKDDGSGYPGGLLADQRNRAARILSILDSYEALIHPRPFRDALVPPLGIEILKGTQGGGFAPDLLRELLGSLTLFPVGHFVELSSGEIARVKATHREHPLRPDVEVFVDARGKQLDPPRPMTLREDRMIGVVRVLPQFRPR